MIGDGEFLLNKGILYYFATNDDIKGFEHKPGAFSHALSVSQA